MGGRLSEDNADPNGRGMTALTCSVVGKLGMAVICWGAGRYEAVCHHRLEGEGGVQFTTADRV